MAAASTPGIDKAVHKVEKAVAKAHPWIEPAARFGYAMKGLVYALIGLLALLAAWHVHVGQRGDELNQRGILNFLARQWFGTAALIAISIGLAGYALWRLISAVVNAEEKGPLKRIGYAFSGLAYGSLAYMAAVVVLGARAETNDESVAWRLIDQPFGRLLLLAVGLIALGVALGQLWNAVTAKFMEVFERGRMSDAHYRASVLFGRIGLSARAVLFGLIGGFFIAAGVKADPRSAGGIQDALATMQDSVGGNWLLAADCLGLVCYGLFMFLEARFRKIRMADEQVIREVNGHGPEPSHAPT